MRVPSGVAPAWPCEHVGIENLTYVRGHSPHTSTGWEGERRANPLGPLVCVGRGLVLRVPGEGNRAKAPIVGLGNLARGAIPRTPRRAGRVNAVRILLGRLCVLGVASCCRCLARATGPMRHSSDSETLRMGPFPARLDGLRRVNVARTLLGRLCVLGVAPCYWSVAECGLLCGVAPAWPRAWRCRKMLFRASCCALRWHCDWCGFASALWPQASQHRSHLACAVHGVRPTRGGLIRAYRRVGGFLRLFR